MWKRNLFFAIVVVFGVAALSSSLFSRSRPAEPRWHRFSDSSTPEFRATVDRVNEEFRRDWREREIRPAGRAEELLLLRRLSLGLTGAIPSLEEIRQWEAWREAHPAEDSVQWWLSRLFEDRRYADYVAERLARQYVGTENGPFLAFRRRRFVLWLSDRLHETDRRGNTMPYDELVRRLISEDGLWTDSPAVNFVTATLDDNNQNQPDVIRLAGRTARAFLGMRIDCLQCHDDNLGTLKFPQVAGAGGAAESPRLRDGYQSDFHQLAAFWVSAEQSFTGIRDRERPYRFQYLGEDSEEVVPPRVPFRADLLSVEGTRREQLARWVTHPENKPFARAMVNRAWALLFGKPLVEPIDDLPLNGDFPPPLDTLAEDFAANGFNLRRLLRLIAATEVFQRDSRADFEIGPEHEARWAVFPLSRLRPEQVAGSLLQASSLTTIDAQSHILVKLARYDQERKFVERFGDTGEDEFIDEGGTIPQRLLLMNGEVVRERTKGDLQNAATRIAQFAPTDAKAVETAYLVLLSRRPEPEELRHFTGRLAGLKGDYRNQPLEDLYWALLNSTEFSWNH